MNTTKQLAIPYLKAVRLYAEAKGMPFFTWLEMQVARKCYEQEAITRN